MPRAIIAHGRTGRGGVGGATVGGGRPVASAMARGRRGAGRSRARRPLPPRRAPSAPARRPVVFLADDVAAAAPGGGQGAASRRWPTTRVPQALPGRGPGRRGPEPPEHHGRLRLGRGAARPTSVTEYLGGGSLRAMLDRGRLLSPSQALRRRPRGRPRPRLRPPPGLRPPRHQARQPAVRRRRPPAHRRLRAGPGPGRGGLDRARRRRAGHRPLRLARAGPGASPSTARATSTRWPSCWSSR